MSSLANVVESVVLRTTLPQRVGARGLNRMPGILPGLAEEELWRHGELDDALKLLRPPDASRMSLAPANPALDKVSGVRESAELLVAPS
jgi:hypothetical protein